ncbi:MAG: hypoxanthine phosphoribosyltransferase [Vampirovibrio sp.]|nr:hypoxanthine phosphoribosyltransferase [Vampirovibrio sp.]
MTAKDIQQNAVSFPSDVGMCGRLEVLYSEDQIQARIREMAQEINQTYRDVDKVVVVGILKGAFLFMADLIRHLEVPCQIEFIRLSSYGNKTKSSGSVRPVDLTLPNLADQHVLLVEDIVDTGLTMSFLLEYLAGLHQTKSTRVAVLLDKPVARSPEIEPVPIDFTGFTVGNQFLVGYGLDLAGYLRNLPYIGVFHQDQ